MRTKIVMSLEACHDRRIQIITQLIALNDWCPFLVNRAINISNMSSAHVNWMLDSNLKWNSLVAFSNGRKWQANFCCRLDKKKENSIGFEAALWSFLFDLFISMKIKIKPNLIPPDTTLSDASSVCAGNPVGSIKPSIPIPTSNLNETKMKIIGTIKWSLQRNKKAVTHLFQSNSVYFLLGESLTFLFCWYDTSLVCLFVFVS